MPKFSLEKTADNSRGIVFETFSNFKDYQKLIPQHYPSIRVRSVRGNVSVVEEHLILGNLELLIMAKHISQNPTLHEIFVIGGDAKGSHIRQEFVELQKGTKILVDVDLKLGGSLKLSCMLGKSNLKDDYGKILDDLVKLAEN